ncbi:hypothetical protein R1sor_010499 [Riccia sorocarpa]|uniref:Borealin N-terminal domain-containing protein n=1 Tax=Riccia sorocarpa TaxID=122646 RepID=A0ABD3HY70_9MARC
MKTMPETLREDMRKLQIELSDAVKKIPGQIAEQIAEMKTDLLRTMKKEFQAISRKAYIQTREVLSQKVSKGPAATERRYPYGATKHTTSCHCKEEPRGKRVPRGKKSTTYLRRNTSSYQPSKENVRQDYGREGDLASEMPPKANIGRPPEALAVSGISGLRSEDPSPRRTLDQMPSEAGWVTVRRSENENRPPLLETYSALTNPDRNILTQTLLLKASNTETQCEPIAEHIINTEEFQTSPLVYLGSKATGNNEKTPQVIELSEDSLDETRLLRQRLRARRRRFHCL